MKPVPTIHCTRCCQDKPAHLFYDKGEHEAQARMFVRNCLSMEGRTVPEARCDERCYECWMEAANGYFVSVEREGNAFYCTQAI